MTDKSYSLTITKEQLAELPRVEFPGVIKVVNTAAEARKAVSILKKYPILGFDTESKPTFRKGVPIHVSLIQISADDVCFLFRVRKIDDLEACIRIYRRLLSDAFVPEESKYKVIKSTDNEN